MRIVMLGVGDAFTARHYGTCALIETRVGRPVLIDCPDPINRVLREGTDGRIGVGDIDDILLTHIHGDHSNGLESFGFKRWMGRQAGDGSDLPRLWTTPWTAERLWRKLSPAMSGEGRRSGQAGPATRSLEAFFDVRIIEPTGPGEQGRGEVAEVAGLRVRARWTTHPIPTAGFLVSDGSRTLGWAGDTAYEDAHIEWLSQANLIVHEANLGPAHTPIENLNALPESVRGRMRLVHLPDDFDESCTDIRVLRQGETLDV